MMLILLFFPVPIRAAAVILAVLYALMVISEKNLSEAAHLAGMAGGVIWIWGQRRWPQMGLGLGTRTRTGECAGSARSVICRTTKKRSTASSIRSASREWAA